MYLDKKRNKVFFVVVYMLHCVLCVEGREGIKRAYEYYEEHNIRK